MVLKIRRDGSCGYEASEILRRRKQSFKANVCCLSLEAKALKGLIKKNLSYSMLDLFAPHILRISAGAESMYRHSGTDLIKHYKKDTRSKIILRYNKHSFGDVMKQRVFITILRLKMKQRLKKVKNP